MRRGSYFTYVYWTPFLYSKALVSVLSYFRFNYNIKVSSRSTYLKVPTTILGVVDKVAEDIRSSFIPMQRSVQEMAFSMISSRQVWIPRTAKVLADKWKVILSSVKNFFICTNRTYSCIDEIGGSFCADYPGSMEHNYLSLLCM